MAWATTTMLGALMLTQAIGWDGARPVAAAQALTPYIVVGAAIVAFAAHLAHQHLPAFAVSLVGVVALVFTMPVMFPPPLPAADPDTQGVRLASVNLLYTNDRTTDIAASLVELGLDAVVFNEYTDAHRTALLSSDLADALPYRVEVRGERADGIAIWAVAPLTDTAPPPTAKPSIAAVLDNGVELVGVHPPTPVWDNAAWRRDLAQLATAIADPARPTVVLGDFNATYWNPSFRRLLDVGYHDAAIALGDGLTSTWPTDWLIPPFAAIDHALVERDRLVPTRFDTFSVTGSDHRGIVVTVNPRR
ncbi:MAG: endonuclease/exonuclease/phosphatase family protein [Actinomycetota bacterium]